MKSKRRRCICSVGVQSKSIHVDENKNAIGVEAGFRWMVWKGLNVRIGAIVVAAPDESVKINPTPGISYSFFIK